MSEGNAFDFLKRPPRASKPRKSGVTVVSDKVNSAHHVEAYIESIGPIIA